MTKKLEELKLSMTSGIFNWAKKYLPIILVGGMSGLATTQTDASIDSAQIEDCKTKMTEIDKTLSEQIIKTNNLEARFVDLRQDVREIRGDTRQILVILTGKNDNYRTTANNYPAQD